MANTYPNRHVEIEIDDWFRKDINQGGREIVITIETSVQEVECFNVSWISNSTEESEKFLTEFNEAKEFITFQETGEMIRKYWKYQG